MPWPLRFAPHMGFLSLEQPFFKDTVGSLDPLRHLEYIAAQGFSGIDDILLQLRPVADQERMGRALKELGLEFGSFSLYSDLSLTRAWGSREAEARAQLKKDLGHSLEHGHRVGATILLIVAARDLRLPVSLQLVNMIENLRELSPIAEQAGLILGLEQTSEARVPGMLMHHILDAYAIVKAVNSPAVRLVFDTVHVQIMDGDLIKNLERVWDAVAMIQIADNPGRFEPGTGELNFVSILRFVKERGFQGLVVLEHSMSHPGAEGEQRAMDALRTISDQLG